MRGLNVPRRWRALVVIVLTAACGGLVAVSSGSPAAAGTGRVPPWTGRVTPAPASMGHPAPMHPRAGQAGRAGLTGRAVRAAALGAPLQISSNWAGYVFAGGASFTGASARWTVPAVQATVDQQASATWVGVDGYSTSSLIQTGTSQETANGQTIYYAWYELLPANPQIIGGVQPGDVMQASVTQTAATTWTIAITDVTSSQNFTTSVSYSTPGTSAEWIEEVPSRSDGVPVTLADFGTAHFSAMGVSGTNTSGASTIATAIADSTGNILAYPGAINSATNSFDVFYSAPGSTTTTTSAPTSTTATTVPAPPAPVACAPPRDRQAAGRVSAIAAWQDSTGCAGYWITTAQGQVVSLMAPSYGDEGATSHLPTVAIMATPDWKGYWLVDADGTVHAYGDAVFRGDMHGVRLNGLIIAAAATPDGGGYWLVASDGGIFNFGDARFFGSTGNLRLNRPVVGIAPAPGGAGYWLVASDGGIFAFGRAPFLGSMGAVALNRPVVGMTADPTGAGYRMVGADGGIFSFGAPFYGSLGASPPPVPVLAMAPSTDGRGYYLLTTAGGVYGFGDARYLGGVVPS